MGALVLLGESQAFVELARFAFGRMLWGGSSRWRLVSPTGRKYIGMRDPTRTATFLVSCAAFVCACGAGAADEVTQAAADDSAQGDGSNKDQGDDMDVGSGVTDITDAILSQRSGDCADYAGTYEASVMDINRGLDFRGSLTISADSTACAIVSNNIPNHNFNDPSAHFATDASEVTQSFSIPRNPQMAAEKTALSQRLYNAVMLNGVPLDLLSAGCYRPDSPMADADGNVPIGCLEDDPWLLDPLGTDHGFGTDEHNAHTQPDGSYHYHGNPAALFDDDPGPAGSPVIGFAADGFPIYGSYFVDPDTGELRKARSGWTLKSGERPAGGDSPGGDYDGTYVADWEFTGAGDLDECNGMLVDGQYGYFVTDAYPWVLGCLNGTPDTSFSKGRP